MSNWSELHVPEVTSYKIHILVDPVFTLFRYVYLYVSYSPDSTANSETTIPECSQISSKSYLLKTDQTGSRN